MPWPRANSELPRSVSEAMNLHLAFVGKPRPTPVEEQAVTLQCLRGDHTLPATDADVLRSASEVVYRCPDDGAQLLSIRASAYDFHEGDLTIAVGSRQIPWADYVAGD
jgi:hypothetical protein